MVPQIETSQILDPTKYLSCFSCPLHTHCKKYPLACDLTNNKLYFGASLLCTIERAEYSAMNVIYECKKNLFPNPLESAKTLYKDFLPTLNNFFNAFCKYDCGNAREEQKQAIVFALAESLEYWGLLEYFDFMFSQDIEVTRNVFQKNLETEIMKNENEKLV